MGKTLGSRLHAAREAAGISQRELSRRAKVTAASISLIERDRTSPSVALLKKVLDGLSLSLSGFFTEAGGEEPNRYFYTLDDMPDISHDAKIAFRLVGRHKADRKMTIMLESYEPGADMGPGSTRHGGEEGGVVVEGRIELTVNGIVRTLSKGQAYYFASELPHRFRNPGKTKCVIVSANTPPTI